MEAVALSVALSAGRRRRARVVFTLLALAAGGCAPPPGGADPADDRLAVPLAPAERNFMLEEMRYFVHATRGIVEGIADNNMNTAATAARGAGVAVYRARLAGPATPRAVESKLPPEFRALDLATRSAFDEMALRAVQAGGRDELLAAMADNLRRCVACHATYRFPK
jgi:hypothetical protein